MDEKGRLFGKLNIIDLLVILLVIAVAVLFVVRRGQSGDEEQGTGFELTYQVLASRLTPELYDSISQYVDASQGLEDQMFSSDSNNKLLDAYVVDCTARPHVEYVVNSDGELKRAVSSGDDQRVDVLFTIRAWVTDPITNKVGVQQVRVGADHYIKTTHFEYPGVIQSVERTQS